MEPRNNYCRLCSVLRPTDKLCNLQTDATKLRETMEKLSRINAYVNFSDDSLPKTVCFVCIDALNNAFQFATNVEQAQESLNNLLFMKNIKKEESQSDTEDTTFDDNNLNIDMKINLKFESDSDDLTRDILLNEDVPIKQKIKSKKKKKLDSLPLSQWKMTWSDYNWMCAYCETQFPTVDELKMHSIQYHNCCNAYRCTDCNIRKLRLDSFLVHVSRHRKYLKMSCYKCAKRLTNQNNVKKHQQTHIDTDFVCFGCNTTFSSMDELNKHCNAFYKANRAREIPLDKNDGLNCVVCKKAFKNKSALNTHLLTHTERKREYTCDKCGKCFLHKYNLATHMLLHDNTRPHKCEICKFTFKTASQLRSHVGVHNGIKPYSCNQCGRCFRLQKQLTSHQIIHTDSLPYTCTYCHKNFRFKTILNQHIRQHTGVKPYSCEVCQRDFTNWSNYNKHMKRRHGMDMAKKKHTPDGVYPINPSTGEVIMYPETMQTLEWKKKMMVQRKPGRPKVDVEIESAVDKPSLSTDS